MEGPSIYLLAHELQILVNQTIIRSTGNAHFEKEALVHQTITEIYPCGKRLIIQTQDYALVMHFLMYGTYRIDQPRAGVAPRLTLITRAHQLYVYNCSAKAYSEPDLKRKLTFDFDILSPSWNIARVIARMKKHPDETIDDILLDQDIFAGVGNIIKTETLYLARVLPSRKVKSLNTKKLIEIACNARIYAQQFLEQYDHFELRKYWTVYHKKVCPRGHPITRKITGARKRWSFFCKICQK